MKGAWLHQRRSNRLIIFCNGWGMDGAPFHPLAAGEYDVFMLYDYSDLTLPCEPASLFKRYQSTLLVSWSMGVWVGQQIFQPWLHCLQGAIAINGTLCPIHDRYGIPVSVYDATLEQFNGASRLKFYRRMCRQRLVVDGFLANQPLRSVENQALELAALRRLIRCDPAEAAIYTRVLVADQDLVIPTAHQIAFWRGREVSLIPASHFPFYGWESWDELVAGGS